MGVVMFIVEVGMEEFVCFIIISKWKGIENL